MEGRASDTSCVSCIASASRSIPTNQSPLRVHKQAKRWLEVFSSQRYQQAAVVWDEQLLQRFEAHNQAIKAGNATFEDMILAVHGESVEDGTY